MKPFRMLFVVLCFAAGRAWAETPVNAATSAMGKVFVKNPSDGARLQYDKHNFLNFNYEKIQYQEKGKTRSCPQLVLQVTRDGQPRQIVLKERVPGRPFPLRVPIEEARYAGKDRLWILSRLGNRLSGAILVNLATGALEREIEGTTFALSPSGAHLAYAYPWFGKGPRRYGVYVDGVQVYPRAPSGKEGLWENHSNLQIYRKINFPFTSSEAALEATLEGAPRWLSDTEVQFTMREVHEPKRPGWQGDPSGNQEVRITVSGISSERKDNADKIKWRREVLAPAKTTSAPSAPASRQSR